MSHAPDHRSGPAYRKDIDGLRAVAVLAVIGFHGFPEKVPGGFVGVDVFFVISGYLISGILLRELSDGTFTFSGFYVRRINRIFPALLVLLAVALAFGCLSLLPLELQYLGKHVFAGSGFASNIALWREFGYFDVAAELKPFLHLWSLGIEEQFYIVWPVLLWLSRKLRIKPTIACAVVIAVSFASGLALLPGDRVGTFYSPLTRIWELACGAIMACAAARLSLGARAPAVASLEGGDPDGRLSPPIGPKLAEVLSPLGALLILVAVALFDKKTPFPGWRAALPVAGSCLLITSGGGTWFNSRILSNRLLVLIGIISYPLYLWHWPLLSFGRITEGQPTGPATRAALIASCFALAWLTYHFVERPIRFGTAEKTKTARWLCALLGLVGLSGLLIFLLKGLPGRFEPELQWTTEVANDWEYPARGMTTKTFSGVTVEAVGGDGPQTLFYGDSNIQQYAPRIAALLQDRTERQRGAMFLTAQGGIPIDGVLRDDTGAQTSTEPFLRLAARPEVDRIVIGAAWAGYFSAARRDYGVFMDGRYHLDGWTLEESGGADAAFDRLDKMVAHLVASGKQVTLVLGIPAGREFAKGAEALGTRRTVFVHRGMELCKEVPRRTIEMRLQFANKKLLEIAARRGLTTINPLDSLCDGDRCPTAGHRDQGHLRASFVRTSVTFLDHTVAEP